MCAHIRGDRASILVCAVVLVVIIVGLSASYLVVSGVQARRVSGEIELAGARSAAEAGIDHARAFLLSLVHPAADDPAEAWDAVLASNGGVPSWAREVRTREGRYSVRVLDNDDGDGDPLADSDRTVVLESTGRVSAQATHVIRCILTLEANDPTEKYAILSGDGLLLPGAILVDGKCGRVHSDADLSLQGSTTISRSANASDNVITSGAGLLVGDGCHSDQPIIAIPPVVPSVYRPYATCILTGDGRVLSGATGLVLYDFGAPRKGKGSAPGPYGGFTWDAHAGWSTVTSGWVDGVYYVEGSITFNHGGTEAAPWRVAIVAEGSISMQGNPVVVPSLEGRELFIAGGDIYARGTGSATRLAGILLAHEQVDLSGNISLEGRVVAESATNTAGSPVDNRATPLLAVCGGGAHIHYEGGLPRSLVTDWRLPIRSWQEELITNVVPGAP